MKICKTHQTFEVIG